MASEAITAPMMNIPVPQSGNTGPSSSTPAAKAPPKPASAPKSSFADELSKSDSADSAPSKTSKPAPDKPKSPVGDRDERAAAPKPDDDKLKDAQAKAQDSSKKLAPLKKAAASSKQAIDDAPVVALLTGHLEKVQPTDIPDLVSGNAFVADAIGEADIGAFMNKPASIGDILDDLDLPKGLADIAQQMGLDLDSVVTPSELLRAIGVDPGKVTAELTNLKTSLGAEGLAPYMRKAAQLAGQAGAPQQPLEPYPGWAKNTTAPAVPQTPVTGTFDPTKMTQTGPVPSPIAGTKVAAPTADAKPQGMGLTPDDLRKLAENPQVAALGVTPEQLFRMLSPGLAADSVKRPGEQVKNLSPGAQPLAGQMPGMPAMDMTGLQMPSTLPSDAPAAPSMNKASFDAFSLLGDKLKTMETASVDMTKVPQGIDAQQFAQIQTQQLAQPARTLEEQLLSPQAQLNGLGNVSVKAPTAANMQPDLSQVTQVPTGKPEIAPSDVTERIAAKPNAFAQPAMMTTKDLSPRSMNMTQAVPADEIRLATPMMSDQGRGMGQDAGQQGQEERSKDESTPFASADRALSEMMNGKTHGVAAHGKHGFTLHNTPEVGMTSEQRLDMFQKVMDRATSLMKDGGGTVRIDFGSSGLGQLEMAVKMDNDKMDLKILTGSDRVKEAVMSELGRLRDALSVQNVQLGQVDVGVGGRQPQSQGFNFSQGGHGFQQQQQQAFSERQNMPERRVSEFLDAGRLAELRRPMPAFAASQLMNNSSGSTGRIAVRV